MIEKDFDPQTMTRANGDDIISLWIRLWGEWPIIRYIQHRLEDDEILDFTQQ